MTDIEPSPSGYRGQDEAPGPISCSPGSFKYAGHAHHAEHKQQQTTGNYVKSTASTYNNQEISVQQNVGYRRKSENSVGRRGSFGDNETNAETKSQCVNKKANIAGYNEGYKKNTAGYKNDSGYSESVGFDSFSLPLNERDDASPPPTPPVRDASSLKGVCYGPGHEKYPSWPSAPDRHSDDEPNVDAHGGSHRSKSWTDHTNYPKEKPAQYTRPLAKRPNPAFTQQLKTVMERCEKIPAETFESRGTRVKGVEEEPRLWPRVDREGKPLGDAEYVVPSPPEREQQQPSQTISHAELEAYVRSYQDPQVSQVDVYRETALTQAGLEEYTRVQHSQQASYAQSEGYHSYVSSVDSTTNTPFLDRLRRDSEAVAQRRSSTWEEGSREGRDSVVTTSSGGSASSSETLKWHGSMSDVSVTSGLQVRQTSNDRWERGSMSDVSSGNGGQRGSTSELNGAVIGHSSRHSRDTRSRVTSNKKWQATMNDRNNEESSSLPTLIGSASIVDVVKATTSRDGNWQESSIDEDAENSMIDDRSLVVTDSRDEWSHGSLSDVSQSNSASNTSKQLIAHSARVQTPKRHHSESVLYLDRERIQRKIYPIVGMQENATPQHLSVAERINELEKQQHTRYTYLDPEKRHRVSDPTLKAIQKKALLSFYERHHRSSWRSEPQLAQGSPPNAQSPPPQPPPRPSSTRRASSASDYSTGSWRDVTNRALNLANDPPASKHRHSNSCASLSSDLLGPVIVGSAISIDDWVPERPPKKAHLRRAFPDDRVPSPDLPPPSPPNVTEHEVADCDDPLPPPPPEFSADPYETRDSMATRTDKRSAALQTSRRSKRDGRRNEREDRILKNGETPSTTRSNVSPRSENFLRPSWTTKERETDVIGRSSLRCPSARKLIVNGRVAPSRKSTERLFASRPPARLPDLVSQRYSDSGNQRPAPQVPVETRIVRQESMRVESARIDASGLLRNERETPRYESSSGQRPQPQVPSSSAIVNYQSNVDNANYSVASTLKTGYEASSKLIPENSPRKYHEPPKYTAVHHQRNYYAPIANYHETTRIKPQPQCTNDIYGSVNSPPPLAPRLNTTGRKSFPPPPPRPPHALQGSQSKASYLSYRRERGAPDSVGSYKRTMSPTARLDNWPIENSASSRDNDDPVLLRVTPRQSPNHRANNPQSQHNSQRVNNDLPKSHSVDALHQRIEERSAVHSSELTAKLSREPTCKISSTETRGRRESNNNNECADKTRNNDDNEHKDLQPVNDRNRQFERERRKLAASCEPLPRLTSSPFTETSVNTARDFYRERSATIEMTSKNVELLNRRNALAERRVNKFNSNATTMTECNEREMRNVPSIVKPPLPLSSPPNSPNNLVTRDVKGAVTLSTIRGAVPRRSGSCSSSNSTKSSSETNQSSSTRNSHNNEGAKHSNDNDQSHDRSRGNGRRKISSPSQTDDNWSNSPRARSSQTEVTIANVNVRRNSRSRSSSLSSASKISSSSSASASSSSSSSATSSSATSPRYSPIETKNSPCVSPQPGIEGLALVQRTEILLRVNSTTIDASSQTDIFHDDDSYESKISAINDNAVSVARRKLPEEIECEELSRDLANQLGPDDKLVPILLPAPEHKKPTDYVSGLFTVEATLQPRPRRPPSLEDFNSTNSLDTENENDTKNETMPSTPTSPLSVADSSGPLSPNSAYFTTSEGKARFLTRYSRDVTDEDISACSNNSTRSNSKTACNPNDSLDLRQKKEELVLRLDKKVVVLMAEQEAVRDEGMLNEALGARVSTRVSAVARPAEASKYRLHVEEVGKITSLLLGLSGRLARAENALYGMPADHPERKILESKRDKLIDQLEEAKILKCNIDKRSVNVSAILSKYLNDDEYADYQHFINMKAKLIIDGREIQDKVKLGEEQLAALKEAID